MSLRSVYHRPGASDADAGLDELELWHVHDCNKHAPLVAKAAEQMHYSSIDLANAAAIRKWESVRHRYGDGRLDWCGVDGDGRLDIQAPSLHNRPALHLRVERSRVSDLRKDEAIAQCVARGWTRVPKTPPAIRELLRGYLCPAQRARDAERQRVREAEESLFRANPCKLCGTPGTPANKVLVFDDDDGIPSWHVSCGLRFNRILNSTSVRERLGWIPRKGQGGLPEAPGPWCQWGQTRYFRTSDVNAQRAKQRVAAEAAAKEKQAAREAKLAATAAAKAAKAAAKAAEREAKLAAKATAQDAARAAKAAAKVSTAATTGGPASKKRKRESGGVGESAVVAAAAAAAPVDEPVRVYCTCRNAHAGGDMVACDNDACASGEWFHFECVGLTTQPHGDWYCAACEAAMAHGVKAAEAEVVV